MSWPDLYPFTSRINAADHLEIGGCDVIHLANEFGTPLYVFDRATLTHQAREAQAAFDTHWSNALVLYATKAYFAPFLAQIYRELGLGLDVTSEGELEIARRAKFDPNRIYLHGNNKTQAEIHTALRMGVGHIVVDNLDEIALIAALAHELHGSPKLLLRLSPDIDPHTHRYLTTGVADSKFGLSVSSGDAERAFEEISRHPNLRLVGLHVHIGSQIFDPEPIERAVKCALDVARDWHMRFGFELHQLNVGGGWGVAYSEEQNSLHVDTLAANVAAALRAGLAERGLSPRVQLLVEPGRALVARAAVALYRVGAIKEMGGFRTYASVDGGMGDNVRPALYGTHYSARIASRFSADPARTYSIAGRYCEQGDILIESVALPRLERGDLLTIPVAGAYQLPMASNYNLIARPAVVLVSEGTARLVRRRETISDLLALDQAFEEA